MTALSKRDRTFRVCNHRCMKACENCEDNSRRVMQAMDGAQQCQDDAIVLKLRMDAQLRMTGMSRFSARVWHGCHITTHMDVSLSALCCEAGSRANQQDRDVSSSKILPTKEAKFCAAQQKPRIARGFCYLGPVPLRIRHATSARRMRCVAVTRRPARLRLRSLRPCQVRQ